jgi:hypothetical protein
MEIYGVCQCKVFFMSAIPLFAIGCVGRYNDN